jgi:aspartate-semialdehyde dehydrogenase
MMVPLNVAVVGATGAVGRQLIEVLVERAFPVEVLRLFASESSIGEFIDFQDKPVAVLALDDAAFVGCDVVFFCAGASVSAAYVNKAKAAGALCIDISLPWREDSESCLVAPEINGLQINRAKQRRLSCPDVVTTMLAVPLAALAQCAGLKQVVASSYEAVSGCGLKAVDELRLQCGELLNGRPAKNGMFPHQMAFNCLPQVGSFIDNGQTDHERQVELELRTLLGSHLAVAMTAVRVPVFYGHSASVYVEFDQSVTLAQLQDVLRQTEGIEWLDVPMDHEYPTPVDASGCDGIAVGRLRMANEQGTAVQFFVALDNLRKGAATNMVQILEQVWAD